MTEAFYPPRVSEPEFREHFVKFVGGTSAVTKVWGRGITVTYISSGLVDIAWSESPGTYLGFTWSLEATTASGLKGFTVVAAPFNATTNKLRVSITGASESLTDLAASQWINMRIAFKETGAGV